MSRRLLIFPFISSAKKNEPEKTPEKPQLKLNGPEQEERSIGLPNEVKKRPVPVPPSPALSKPPPDGNQNAKVKKTNTMKFFDTSQISSDSE